MGVRDVVVVSAFIALMGSVVAQAADASRSCSNITRYNVMPLPFTPKLITQSGVVAGIADTRRAVVWRRKTGVEQLSVPEGFSFTEPVAVMPTGQILIDALDAEGHKRGAFTYSNHRLAALPGKQTWARGVGAAGMIVGEWVPEGGTTTDAVYWSHEVPHSLGLCCGGVSKAVNVHGTLVGDAYDDHGHYHAFSWSPADGQRMVDSTDAYSSAVAINSAGHILLQVGGEGYLYEAGQLKHLDLASKGFNSIQAMNDCDEVVGGYGPEGEHYHAFLWSRMQGFRDLNSLLLADSGWKLKSADAINDSGEIVGTGGWHGEVSGFLLTPLQ
jgi:uncharacterized membrane protein